MARYVCSLPNRGEPGNPKELISDNPALIKRFIKAEDRPGRGVYECINPLMPGARRRSLETVLELARLYFDLDLPNIEESRDQVISGLEQLPASFAWLRDSGSSNLHAGIELKEPPPRGTPEYDRAAAIWKSLAEKLAADPAPAHPAALIRCLGTHNTKGGNAGQCRELWNGGRPMDLSELEELDDFLVEPLFTRRASASHPDVHAGTGERKAPIDVEARLAAMTFQGPGDSSIHLTQLSVTASLLRSGVALEEAARIVLEATRTAVANDPTWDWRKEHLTILRMGCAFIVKKPELAALLPDAWRAPFEAALAKGRRPDIGFNPGGFYVRAWKTKTDGDAEQTTKEKPEDKTRDKTADGSPSHKLRFKLVPFHDLRPGPEPLYLVDELIPVAGLVDVWGKAKCFKSFWCLDLMLHVAMGWEYRDRYVRQGAVVYCAFEGAHGYKKRVEALRRHYAIAEGTPVPLHVMPGQANLIAEHAVLISDIAAQLGEVRPAAVVLDTLNKSLFGSENKDVDMGAYVRAAEAIRDAFGCVVIIVHHCGYDDTRPRGHSSLPGAVDAQLAVTRVEEVITVTVEMMRDGPEDIQVVSAVEVVDVGQDQNGKVLTSLAVVPSDADAAIRERHGWPRGLSVFHAALKAVLAAKGEMFQPEAGVLPVRAADQWFVRDRFYATYAEGEEDTAKRQTKLQKAFVRALAEAQQRSIVRVMRTDSGRIMLWLPLRGEDR